MIIAIVNQSSVVPAGDAAAFATAANEWLARDFCPAWKLDTSTVAFCADGVIPDGAAPHYLLDNSDQAGDIAYHLPDGSMRTFCKDSLDDGEAWQIAASHEIAEMLVDPGCNQFGPDGRTALECADPVEESSYPVNGIPFTNFVLRAWFDPNGTGPFDFLGHLKTSLTLESGGYMSRYDPASGIWQTINAMKPGAKLSKHYRAMYRGTSRLYRRMAA